jgi:hypothetical protein
VDESRQTSRLFGAIREAQDAELQLGDVHERARARARLLQAVEGSPVRAASARASSSATPWRWLAGGLVAAACAMAVVINLPSDDAGVPIVPSRTQPLAYTLDGASVDASQPGPLSQPSQPSQPIIAGEYERVLAFNDSTRVELAPLGELRIADLRHNGATVELARGEVTLAVHHEDDTSWQVAAGPWSVHVTGTQFSVAWDPTTEHFRVAVTEGSVRVEGPEGDVAKLRAGESLVRERKLALAPVEPSQQPDPLVPAPLDPTLEPSEATPSEPSSPSKASPQPRPQALDWQALARESHYPEAWAALEDVEGGVLGEADRVGVAAMLDLADVARFTDHRSDAKRVLERLRERFPATTQAGDAAFELGRIAADGGNDEQAASWFETYLDERPNGSLVNDALVRLMNAYSALGRSDDARSAATRYLDRQPDGPHAAKAQKLL